MNDKKIQIRNSTVDFLVFTRDVKEEGIEVRVQDNDVWLTQKAIGQLFDVDRSVVTKHLKNIFKDGEIDENSTCANFAQVADNGKTYQYKFYPLQAIIAVGYRINSQRATEFRQWAKGDLPVFAFSSQAKGFFEKYATGDLSPKAKDRYLNEESVKTFHRIKERAEKEGVTLSYMALKMLREQSNFDVFTIVGPSKVAQLKDTLNIK